jgi:sortase (surface protein transpeptidase)
VRERGRARRRPRPSKARILFALVLPFALLVAGFSFLLAGLSAIGSGPPAPSYPDPVPGARVWSSTVHVQPMRASAPVRVSIPAINVDAAVAPVGNGADGSIGIPPLSQPQLAGWYRYGRTPGERGASVIVGHVDSHIGNHAVFFDLGKLRRGAEIDVRRQDGSVAEFKVDAVSLVARDRFPAGTVYGQLPYPGLRLITCGGTFDTAAGAYPDNVVVFASLVAQHVPLLGLLDG